MPQISKNLIAEFLGTFMLVFIAVGTARVLGPNLGDAPAATTAAIALSFGFALMAGAYALGAYSGCHFNPAVSIGAWAAGEMSIRELIEDILAQCAGAIAAAFILSIILAGGGSAIGSGTNAFGASSAVNANFLQAAVFEFTATAIFVFVILGVVARKGNAVAAGMVIGFVLVGIHLIGIQITGTSVNPARSLGPAILNPAADSGRAIGHLWVFLVFPSLGGLVAGLIWRVLFKEAEEAKLD